MNVSWLLKDRPEELFSQDESKHSEIQEISQTSDLLNSCCRMAFIIKITAILQNVDSKFGSIDKEDFRFGNIQQWTQFWISLRSPRIAHTNTNLHEEENESELWHFHSLMWRENDVILSKNSCSHFHAYLSSFWRNERNTSASSCNLEVPYVFQRQEFCGPSSQCSYPGIRSFFRIFFLFFRLFHVSMPQWSFPDYRLQVFTFS